MTVAALYLRGRGQHHSAVVRGRSIMKDCGNPFDTPARGGDEHLEPWWRRALLQISR
ncbi:hypothetical protein WMF11_18170 [Sorangium sp. So ce295]|jgi:hypothetical protein|uniref:hypothetical protein n=1 Tax=Sorangium sp. So ce295 TaxID=3133295 RepID=UPI003F62D0B0